MKTSRILGCAAAAAITAVAALPSASQAQTTPFPTGCGTDNQINLAPLANVTIKTCDLAVAPECAAKILRLPHGAPVHLQLTLCVPEITFG
jgi:hypothetical protein